MAAIDRSIESAAWSPGGSARSSRSAAPPVGSATRLPDPWRLSRNPSPRSRSYAAVVVVRLTPSTAASSRSDGSRARSGTRPSSTSARSAPASAAYPGPEPSQDPSSRASSALGTMERASMAAIPARLAMDCQGHFGVLSAHASDRPGTAQGTGAGARPSGAGAVAVLGAVHPAPDRAVPLRPLGSDAGAEPAGPRPVGRVPPGALAGVRSLHRDVGDPDRR